jgi:hypothetical protein
MPDLYDTDFVAWADEQAELLRQRRFELLDLDNLIEEVDYLAGKYRDALESHLTTIMTHLLKLAYTEGSRDPERGWRISVRNARKAISRLIDRHPSLGGELVSLGSGVSECVQTAYRYARQDAHDELADFGDTHAPFPDTCPWSLQEVLDEGFWPEATP